MEEAYRAAGLAVAGLVSATTEEMERVKNQAILRSMLQRRPVILGYALSNFAERLRENSEAARSPHTGILLALEGILGASYDPSRPHALAPVVDALGEDSLEALLLTPGSTGPPLSWAARLCLLHACLAGGATTRRMWALLPAVADSACSCALQEIATTKGGSSFATDAIARGGGDGKGRAQVGSSVTQAAPNETRKVVVGADGTGWFPGALMARVCGDLSSVGDGGGGSDPRSHFLSSYAGPKRDVAGYVSSSLSACPADLFAGQSVAESLRLKLHALRDALTSRLESEERAAERQPSPTPSPGMEDAGMEDFYVHPGMVVRALERSHCDKSFILAVQAVLETQVNSTAIPKDGGQSSSSSSSSSSSPSSSSSSSSTSRGGRRVVLKHALEACLFGSGLPTGRGLFDEVTTDSRGLNVVGSSAPKSVPSKIPGVDPPSPSATPDPVAPSQACAFIEGLVEVGARVRGLLLALLGMYQEMDRRHPPERRRGAVFTEPDLSCCWTASEVVATVGSACELRRRAVAELARAFLERVVDAPWVWGVTNGADVEDWEGDFAAAAMTISTMYPPRVAASRGGMDTSPASGRELKSKIGGISAGGEHTSSGGQGGQALPGSGVTDPMELLDRLVVSAAMAMGFSEADNVEWIHVLRRVTAADTAADSLRAYAMACVEKSAALGGQAPFSAAGKRRFSHVSGGQLWEVLEGAYVFHGRPSMLGGQEPASVLVRVATTAITTARRMSHSWMISPGMLDSGPIRVVMDFLSAARGCVTVSDLLTALLRRPTAEGPALAADLFAAFIAAAACESERKDGDGSGPSGLRPLAIAWLSSTITPLHQPGSLSVDVDSTIASDALTRNLIRRVPFEAKPVLLAVEEAARLASAGGRGKPGVRRSGKRKHVSEKGEGLDGDAAVASLLKVAHGAIQSPLLPLPVPVLREPPCSGEGEQRGELGAGAEVSADGGPNKPAAGGDGDAGSPNASTAAALLLDAFVQSPAAVRRSIRQKLHRRDCDDDFLAVQRSLRRALCTAPVPAGERAGGLSTAEGEDDSSGQRTPLLDLGARRARKAPACMLVGYLVENGVPGWEETKAAMIPPPTQLLEAAEGPVHQAGCDRPRLPLTALRLDRWLRSLLCDADSSRFDAGFDIESSFPDVFRTARSLARAIGRHASYLVLNNNPRERGPGPNVYHGSHTGSGDYFDAELPQPTNLNGSSSNRGGGGEGTSTKRKVGVEEGLESPRLALAGRLQGAPNSMALVSWLPGVVQTVKQYKQWLPWQPFADELRELLVLSIRQRSAREGVAAGEDDDGGGSKALAAEAAVFAVCELLISWDEAREEVIAVVFQPALCSRTLRAAVAPVSADGRPPIWLEVLRCLVGEAGRDGVSSCTFSDEEGQVLQRGLHAVAASAAVWIGGDGPGAVQSGSRSSREAWMHWYGAELACLIQMESAGHGDWLILSGGAADSRVGGVRVRKGVGGSVHTVQPEECRRWGRSPLEAAWNFPGGWRREAGEDGKGTPPTIVLPPFASWLRVVLRGGPSCPEGLLEAYLRRMAREVYLPCQFGGASGEMAHQWLGALIDAEAEAEERTQKNASMDVNANASAVGRIELHSANAVGAAAPARELVVKLFFREELLRFGSGQAAASAPSGGPLTWLWPLEAVVAACGSNGPFGVRRLARLRRHCRGLDDGSGPGAPPACIDVDGPPSALARALCTVPHDLLCGSRRFDSSGGQPPPATATLLAFATRAVNLTARALSTPPCRHWSVARRLLLGLGLLYHALAESRPAARDGISPTPRGGGGGGGGGTRAESMDTVAGHPPAADKEASAGEECAAQGGALSAIENLVRIALGLGDDVVDADGRQHDGGGTSSGPARGERRRGTGAAYAPMSTTYLPSVCRALRPLETGSCVGADDYAEALRGAGAWRAANAFFGRPKAARGCGAAKSAATSMEDASSEARATSSSSSAAATPSSSSPSSAIPVAPPLSVDVDLRQHQSLPSPGAMPVAQVAQAVSGPTGGHQARCQSTADRCVSPVGGGTNGKRSCGAAGGNNIKVDSPHTPPSGYKRTRVQQDLSRQSMKTRLGGDPADVSFLRPPPSAERVTRASKRLRRRDDALDVPNV